MWAQDDGEPELPASSLSPGPLSVSSQLDVPDATGRLDEVSCKPLKKALHHICLARVTCRAQSDMQASEVSKQKMEKACFDHLRFHLNLR